MALSEGAGTTRRRLEDPRILFFPLLATGRWRAPITEAAVVCGAKVAAAPRLRHRLVPSLNASTLKISLELILP